MKCNILFIKFYEISCTLSSHLSNYCNLVLNHSLLLISLITTNFIYM